MKSIKNIVILASILGICALPAHATDELERQFEDQNINLTRVIQNAERKTLLLVEPCLSSHLLVLNAEEHGYNSIVISANSDSRRLPEQAVSASTAFFQIDTNDDEGVLKLVDQIAAKVRIDAVIPGAEYYVPLTGKISTHLGKLGLSPESALRARRKDLMRDALKEGGVPIPIYRKVTELAELRAAVEEIGFPCVIKPVDLAGSINVKKALTLKEAELAFQTIIEHPGVDPAWGNRTIQNFALVEQYIAGKEYSIEGFSKNKEVHIAAVTEKFLSPEPDFVEVGHIVRSTGHEELEGIVQVYITKVVSALDLHYGPFHAEVRMSKDGPILMEIAMRLAGDYVPKLVNYATGINYYENTLNLLSGEELSLKKEVNTNAGITFFYNPGLKTVQSNEYLLSLADRPHVMGVKPYYKVGDIVPDQPMEKHKLGYAIVVHEDYEALKDIMMELEKNATF